MATLSKDLRRQLEKTVAEARVIAEQGAEQSLHRLAVELPRPHDALNDVDKKLRVSLRAHAKQLGDRLDQRPLHLIQAVAYEHWHRLLFARFLIENDLLLHPEHGVALSLDEIKEIALGENREWVEVAADYAQHMLLRRVFQPDDPALRVSLPPEKRQQIEEKLYSLPREVFLADDSLGWVYQFWQRDEKDRVNESEAKIGANELPAVTQLFTEDYMVLFILENTLGAWWTAKRRSEGKETDLPGYRWTYLRLNEDGSPAAGSFEGWPRSVRELQVLDPCMGSGHFLAVALPIVTRMLMEEDGLSLKDSIAAALRDNLFGLELDTRCAQIAAFNLALTSWRLVGAHFPLPEMNLACSGLGINASESDWLTLAGDDTRAREEMRRLYSLFKDAPTLGSLVDPLRLQATIFLAGAERVLPLLEQALKKEQETEETRELAIAAKGVLAAFRILASRFTLVATNVPYLGRSKQDKTLAQYCADFHSDAKADLATCFVDRCLRFCRENGSVALVTPQNWLFLTSYKKLRERLLRREQWDFVVRLGEHAFDSPAAAGAFVAVVGLSHRAPSPEHAFAGWDVAESRTPDGKAAGLRKACRSASQQQQLNHPDMRIALDYISGGTLLSNYANAYWGQGTGDFVRFGRFFWEVPAVSSDYELMQSTTVGSSAWGGREWLVFWQRGQGELVRLAEDLRERLKNIHYRGKEAWGKSGVTVSLMRNLPVTLYGGQIFDGNCAAIVPNDISHLPAIWAFCESPDFVGSIRAIDQKINVSNHTLLKIPFNLEHWQSIAAAKYPSGLPQPSSDDPSQWIFNGHPSGSQHPLQVAVARLLGYRWPRQTGSIMSSAPPLDADGLEAHADLDGIVSLSSIGGEASAADRLRALLADAYEGEWSATKLSTMLDGYESLEIWLRDRFFEHHCEIFYQRPFIWHIWDGRKDGFHVLLNSHKLTAGNEGRKTLEKVIYTSLGDWIARQRQDVITGIEGADGRLAAAEHLQYELKKILEGENPYDVFVRWKPLKEQPLGWNPDLNDGVRLNIRPWITEAKLYRATKPGILRVSPNIKYGKDRGKEPARDPKDFPWLKESSDRVNDAHLTLKEKRAARGAS